MKCSAKMYETSAYGSPARTSTTASTPAAAAEMNYFLGEWAYDAQDWARARQYLQAARAGVAASAGSPTRSTPNRSP